MGNQNQRKGNVMVKALTHKRRGLAVEMIFFLIMLIVIGIIYASTQPIFTFTINYGIANGVDSGVLTTLINVWNNAPLVFIFAGILFIMVAAMRRDTGTEYLS